MHAYSITNVIWQSSNAAGHRPVASCIKCFKHRRAFVDQQRCGTDQGVGIVQINIEKFTFQRLRGIVESILEQTEIAV